MTAEHPQAPGSRENAGAPGAGGQRNKGSGRSSLCLWTELVFGGHELTASYLLFPTTHWVLCFSPCFTGEEPATRYGNVPALGKSQRGACLALNRPLFSSPGKQPSSLPSPTPAPNSLPLSRSFRTLFRHKPPPQIFTQPSRAQRGLYVRIWARSMGRCHEPKRHSSVLTELIDERERDTIHQAHPGGIRVRRPHGAVRMWRSWRASRRKCQMG